MSNVIGYTVGCKRGVNGLLIRAISKRYEIDEIRQKLDKLDK